MLITPTNIGIYYSLNPNQMNNAIKTILSGISLLKIVPSTIAGSRKDKAIIYQTITREYAGARGSNSNEISIAPVQAYGQGQTFTSKRNAFVNIPKGATEESVKTWLTGLSAGAKIYSIMSNDVMDVLTVEEISQLPADERLRAERIANYRSRYEMQNAKGECFLSGDGKFQYRRNFLNVNVDDVDKRSVKTSQSVPYRNKNAHHVNYMTGELVAVTDATTVVAGAVDSARPDDVISAVAPATV